MKETSDEDLLRRTPTDPDAFAVFYRRHESMVIRFFMSRTRDPHVTADLTAETFAAALLSTRRYRADRAGAAAWLLGIAQHKLLRSLRRRRVEQAARRRLEMPVLEIDDELAHAIEASASSDAEAWLATLPPDQADAVRARVLNDERYSEIAGRLRCSEAVVRKRVSRGLAALRTTLEEGPQ